MLSDASWQVEQLDTLAQISAVDQTEPLLLLLALFASKFGNLPPVKLPARPSDLWTRK